MTERTPRPPANVIFNRLDWSPPGDVRRLTYRGNGGTLFGVVIVNVFLALVTFGIYSFWGRVRVRNYLWSQSEFAGDRFAYHGNGKELLIGSFKASVLIGIPIILLGVVRDLMDVDIVTKVAADLLTSLIVLIAVPYAMVGARRYRLSRTSWRGIRFSFRGGAKSFIKLFVIGSILTFVTLALYYPIFIVKRHAFMLRHSYFGNHRFDFDGVGRELLWPFIKALLLTLPTLGLNWFWFQATKRRFLWNHTSFGSARFRCTITGRGLFGLHMVNFVILIFTMGLAWPWVKTRNVNFTFANLSLHGPVDLQAVQQEAQAAPVTGEGLAGFFDLDAGFDLG